MLTLKTEISKINKIGAGMTNKLKKLGLKTVQDLIFHFPFRYDDFTKITAISKLQPETSANVVGKIELIQNKRSLHKRMNITEALVSDDSETVKIIWFNQPFIARNLHVGDKVSLAGKIESDYSGMTMKSPAYEKIINNQTLHTQGLVPNYHLTGNITQKQVRFLIKQIISLADQIIDWLPDSIKNNLNLLNLVDAVTKIHFPKTNTDIEQAKKRLGFDELFLIQLQSQLIKKQIKSKKAIAVKFLEKETKQFVKNLNFKLTDAQRKAAWEILQDIGQSTPMSRLLEGDVGSGKTVVAVIAMLNVALNNKLGGQSALMVPTEILAQQHFNSISKLLAGTGIKIGLITRSEKKMNNELGIRKKELEIKNKKLNQKENKKNKKIHNSKFIIHNSNIIIGTHALIQEKIKFKNLVLAIIDEQHRFGVEQRKMLVEKAGVKEAETEVELLSADSADRSSTSVSALTSNKNRQSKIPHILSMTATPIPRSLALALHGNLDISIINEMPKGRKKVITKIVPEENRQKAYDFIQEQIKNNRQVFVICPLIDFSDKLGVKSVKQEFEKLDKQIFPNLSIAILHGRMKSKEKETIMRDFLNNKINILIATSVVEVGIDVPNASIMMIEGSDRFGLSQLHQFRGRVGRSEHQSYCFLFTDNSSEKTSDRLQALVDCDDGFALAKMDLKFRGPGEVYGTAQTGFPELKIASLFDYNSIKQARDQVERLLNQDFDLKNYPELKKRMAHNA
ncbi:ATP-dependent DNA helicase RecG [Patescibacteria group bacterium]|nr:ATP-dependent DNA helicase RecG [Patescibacteria group bacterium]